MLEPFFTGPGLTHEAQPHWQVGHGHGGSHVGAQAHRRFDPRPDATSGAVGAVTALWPAASTCGEGDLACTGAT